VIALIVCTQAQSPLLFLDARYADVGRGGRFPLAAAHLLDQRQSFIASTQLNHRSSGSIDSKALTFRYRRYALAFRNTIALAPVDDWTRWDIGWAPLDWLNVGIDGDFWRIHPSSSYQVFGQWKQSGISALFAPAPYWLGGVRAFGGVHPHNRGAEVIAEYSIANPALCIGLRGAFNAHPTNSNCILTLGTAWYPVQYLRLQGIAAEQFWETGIGCEYRLVWLYGAINGEWNHSPPKLFIKGGVRW
jgi:hypothetical protein